MKKFTGVGVALVTPFNEDKSVDFKGLENLVNHTINIGVDYLVVLGTTGESATCTLEEKQQVLAKVLEVNAGRKPIVFGIGSNNTAEAVTTFDKFDLSGVDAILSASPFYNKPTQEGIFQHYSAIADKSPLPIILYNVPGRTASNVTAETTLRLAQHNNIIAIKEASGDLEQCMKIAKDKPSDFMLISGDDLLTTSMISFGCEGVISVLANTYEKFPTLVHKALDNDFKGASALLFDFIEINNLMYTEANPVGVKAGLEILGVCGREVRLPLLKASEGLMSELKELM